MTTNTNLAIANLAHRYNAGTATHAYVFGFVRNGQVWAVQIDYAADLLASITCYDKSRDALRFCPNKAQQEIILAHASRVEIICSVDALEELKAEHNNNRGDTFEFLVAKRWGAVQHQKRNEKFTDCGDITLKDGREVQVKFGCPKGKATFTDGKTLARFGL